MGLAAAGLLLFSSGCETLSGRRDDNAREEMSRLYLEQKVERIETLSTEALEHRRRLDERIEQVAERNAASQEALSAEIDAVKRDLERLRSDREQLRREIVDDITARVSGILSEQTARRDAERRGAGPRVGREHTVGPGQTISEIAAVYGTTVQAIVEANNLTDPDKIRVGRKLFIPE